MCGRISVYVEGAEGPTIEGPNQRIALISLRGRKGLISLQFRRPQILNGERFGHFGISKMEPSMEQILTHTLL